jgi:hypothetical protein
MNTQHHPGAPTTGIRKFVLTAATLATSLGLQGCGQAPSAKTADPLPSWTEGTMIAPAVAYVGQWLQSFREYPPRQKPGSFNLDRVMEAVTKAAGDK